MAPDIGLFIRGLANIYTYVKSDLSAFIASRKDLKKNSRN